LSHPIVTIKKKVTLNNNNNNNNNKTQVEGAYIAETLNLVECVESKEDPLIQIARTHQHNTNSALLQTNNRFKRSF
jgi:hypothetical protein